MQSAADRLSAAQARGEVVDLSEQPGVEDSQAVECTADEADEMMTLDDLVAEAEAMKQAQTRKTRRMLRRLSRQCGA